MSGSAVIGALRVVLGADSALFEKGLKDASSALGTFAGIAAKIAPALAAAFTFDKAIEGVKGTIDQFDNLSKTAQKIGVPVEQLSALQHAADLSDVSSENLTKSLEKLAKNTVLAAQGGKESIAAFQSLGINFRDAGGNVKSMSDLLPAIADRFSNMKDGTVKTALAMQIFGKSGAELIPLLNSGSSGLKEMTDEAAALGLTISGDTGKTAEAFNDNLTRLKATFTGIATQVTANILPALAQLSQFLVDTAKNSGILQTTSSALTAGFDVLARAAILVYDNFNLVLQIGALFVGANIAVAAINAGLAFLKMAEATKTLGLTMAFFDAIRGISMRGILLIAGIVALAAGAFDGFGSKIKEIGETIKNMLPEGAGAAITDMLKNMGLNIDGLTKDLTNFKGVAGKDGGGLFNPALIKTTKDALDSYIDSTKKHIAATLAQAQTVGMSNAEHEQLKVTLEGYAIASQNNIPLTEALSEKIAALGSYAAAAAMKLQGAQLAQQVMTPAQQYQQQLDLQTQLFNAGAISADTYAQAQRKAALDAGTAWDIAGASIAGSFQTIGNAFAKESSSMAAVAKIAGAIQATISMFTGAAKALELPFPANLAAMATVLAQGASLVASIKSTAVPKFATGGSFRVGGAGGTDSQRVMLDATPGEVVDVHRNQYGSDNSGGTKVVDVRGLNLRPVWSLDNVRDLIETINKVAGDGMRIRIAPA